MKAQRIDPNAAGQAKTFSASTPRVVQRLRPGVYRLVRLGDLHWVAAHTDERQYMNLSGRGPFLSPKRKVRVPDSVRVNPPGQGTLAFVPADRLAGYVRRPSTKAIARVEAAEEAVKAAHAELAAAKKAAFAYGKAIPLSTLKRVDRERRQAVES